MERAFWHQIIDDQYRLPEDSSLEDLTIELVRYLASPDPELRDTFAYNILARWITVYGYYQPEDLRALVEWLTPLMGEDLGEKETDSVFLRAYAALVLSPIAYRDTKTPFLKEAEVRALLDKARHYLVAERDERAYIPDKGWANACGHTANLLRFLAHNAHLENADLLRILDTIADKLLSDTDTVFRHDEDDRLAQVVMAVLRRDMLTLGDLSNWLKRFSDWKAIQDGNRVHFDPFYHANFQNIKSFLRALYTYMQLAMHIPLEARDFESDLLLTIRAFSL